MSILQVVAIFEGLMGLMVAGVWTKDILFNPEVDTSAGLFHSREPDAQTLYWPHWLAEYSTAGALVAGAIGVFVETSWGVPLSYIALGSMVYTSTNSLGWALAEPERIAYAVPMTVGAIGGLAAIVALLYQI